MQFCSCVSHWNAARVCLTSQYSICSKTHSHPTAVVYIRLGLKPRGFVQDIHKMCMRSDRQVKTEKKDTQAVVHVL